MENDQVYTVGIGSGIQQHTLELQNARKLDVESSESSVSRVKACLLHKENKHEVGSFVVKTFKSKETRDAHLIHYIYLRQHQFPVPSICRPIGETQLLVNDLSIDGENIVFSLNSNMGGFHDNQLKNKESIKQQLRLIADKADRDSIRISADAFFLIVDKHGMGNITLGDLGGIFITDEELQADTGYTNTKEASIGFWNIINTNFTGSSDFTPYDPLYEEELSEEA